MKLATPQLPLFDFFQTLCAWEKQLNQQTLTLVEYELLAKVLDNCPFPLESKEDYYRLCKLLWFKPFHAVADDLNTEGGLFRQKFETFWTDLETFNNTPTNVQSELEKPVETSPENKPIDNSRTLTEEQIREREEQQRKLAEQKRNQGITLSDNDNELSPYWADFSPAKPVNTEGGNIGNMSNAPTNDKRGLAIKQDFTFLEKHQFMPLDYRRLYQLVMSVRRVSFDGGRSGFDFEGSFKQLIQQGYLTEFVYQQRSRRWLNVHLLIDTQGSMAAFEHIGDVIADILTGASMGATNVVSEKEKSHIWYFHNCPNTVLYRNKDLFDAEKLDNWYTLLHKQAPAQIIIFSDAGAARGFQSNERINATAKFLQELTKHRVVWINPVAQSRWQGSSALAIERRVKMFDAQDASFVAAMQTIKGK